MRAKPRLAAILVVCLSCTVVLIVVAVGVWRRTKDPSWRIRRAMLALADPDRKTSAKREPLVEMLNRNAFGPPPVGVDLASEKTQCFGRWIEVKKGRWILYCQTVSPCKLAFLSGTISYAFLFDANGRLLGHTPDSLMPHLTTTCGFVDLDGDGVREKIAPSTYMPDVAPGKRATVFSDVVSVYRIGAQDMSCVFRVLYGKEADLCVDVEHLVGTRLPAICLLALRRGEQTRWEQVARFVWDAKNSRFTGPPGGPQQEWQVVDCGSLKQ